MTGDINLGIIVALLGLSFLIFFHELGHFLAAKLCHVGVLEFSIGMGPRLISRVKNNTRYSLKLLPLGGSCAMLGEDSAGSGDFTVSFGEELPDRDNTGDPWIDYDGVRFRKSEIVKYSFQQKPAIQRFFICIAGVMNNFILAAVFAAVLVFFCGFDPLYITDTVENVPAAEAGFQKDDNLIYLGLHDKHLSRMPGYRDLFMWMYINAEDFDENTLLDAVVLRNGRKETITFKPYYNEEQQAYKLGLAFYGGRMLASTPMEFIKYSYYEFRYDLTIVIQSLKLIAKGRVHRNEVMGPVGTVSVMSTTVEKSSKYGIFNAFLVFLELLSMLSSNLGIMNLLPIPALDGGRLLFILFEMISRRRLPFSIEERINQIGMAALLMLMLVILSNDIWNIISGAYASILGG